MDNMLGNYKYISRSGAFVDVSSEGNERVTIAFKYHKHFNIGVKVKSNRLMYRDINGSDRDFILDNSFCQIDYDQASNRIVITSLEVEINDNIREVLGIIEELLAQYNNEIEVMESALADIRRYDGIDRAKVIPYNCAFNSPIYNLVLRTTDNGGHTDGFINDIMSKVDGSIRTFFIRQNDGTTTFSLPNSMIASKRSEMDEFRGLLLRWN